LNLTTSFGFSLRKQDIAPQYAGFLHGNNVIRWWIFSSSSFASILFLAEKVRVCISGVRDRYFELCGYVGCDRKYNRDGIFCAVARLFSGVLDGYGLSLLCNHRVLAPLCNRRTSLLDPKRSPWTLYCLELWLELKLKFILSFIWKLE